MAKKTLIEFQYLDEENPTSFSLFGTTTGGQTISTYLTSNIVRDVNSVKMEKRYFEAVMSGHLMGGASEGSALRVSTSDNIVYLDTQYSKYYKILLSTQQMLAILELYLKIVEDYEQNPNFTPKPFYIFYEAEGSEAESLFKETDGWHYDEEHGWDYDKEDDVRDVNRVMFADDIY